MVLGGVGQRWVLFPDVQRRILPIDRLVHPQAGHIRATVMQAGVQELFIADPMTSGSSS